MNNFITGLFVMLGSLAGAYLNDYLSNRKASHSEKRKKAMEAYILADRLLSPFISAAVYLNDMQVNKNHSHMAEVNKSLDIMNTDLKNLELIIIEYCDLLYGELINLQDAFWDHQKYLIDVAKDNLGKKFTDNINDIENKCENYRAKIASQVSILKNKIKSEYINKKQSQFNVYLTADKFFDYCKRALKKPNE